MTHAEHIAALRRKADRLEEIIEQPGRSWYGFPPYSPEECAEFAERIPHLRRAAAEIEAKFLTPTKQQP